MGLQRAGEGIKLLQKYRLPPPLPTIVGNPFNMKIIMTQKTGTFAGRTEQLLAGL